MSLNSSPQAQPEEQGTDYIYYLRPSTWKKMIFGEPQPNAIKQQVKSQQVRRPPQQQVKPPQQPANVSYNPPQPNISRQQVKTNALQSQQPQRPPQPASQAGGKKINKKSAVPKKSGKGGKKPSSRKQTSKSKQYGG